MFTKIKHLATIALTTFLVACGGGGGSAPAVTTFNLKQSFEGYIGAAHSYTEVDTGSVSGLNVSGSGTKTETILTTATFENSSALAVTEVRNGTTIIGTQSSTTSSELKYFYNSNKLLVGFTQRDLPGTALNDYGLVQGNAVVLPTAAKVGDTGNLWTMAIYANETKSSVVGTETATWSLSSSTNGNAATFQITYTTANPGNTISSVEAVQYSIDSSGTMTLNKKNNTVTSSGTALANITTTYSGK